MAGDLNRAIKIFLDSSQAQQSAQKYEESIGKLEAKMLAMAEAGKSASVEFSNLSKNLEKQKANYEKYKQQVADTERVIHNLSGATKNELDALYKELAKDLRTLGRETDEYKDKLKLLQAVDKERIKAMQEMRGEVGRQGSAFSRLADGFNKYAAIGASAIAAVTGITMAFKALKDERDKQEESAANLKALTGLGDKDIERMKGFANTLATTTQEGGIIIRQSVTEILDAYTKVGSAKPELLGDADALNEVTKQTMILATAAKMELQPAVDGVTLALNMYGDGADQAARYVNVLAAGSKAGAAEVPSITEAVRKSGVAAAQAKVPIEQLVGAIETLAEKGLKDEIAGTGLKTFFLKLETGAKDTRPSIVGLQTALENLRNKNLSATAMKDMFGLETYNVAQVMINSAKQVKYYTEAVTGTNVAMEQAAINSTTATAKLAQAKNQMTQAGVALVEKMNPALTHGVNLMTLFVKTLVALPNFLKTYAFELVAAGYVLVGYTMILKAQAIEARAVALATDLMNSATIRFIKTVAKNPYTYIITATIGAIVWLNNYLNKQQEVNKEQDKFNDLALKSKKIFEDNSSIEDRIKIMQSLTKEQLGLLRNDIEQQISASSNLDAELLTRAKKVYDSDTKLIQLKKNLNDAKSKIEKAFIAQQIQHREEDVFNEIAVQYSKNAKSITLLKKHISDVDKLLATKKKDDTGDTPTGESAATKALKKEISDEEKILKDRSANIEKSDKSLLIDESVYNERLSQFQELISDEQALIEKKLAKHLISEEQATEEKKQLEIKALNFTKNIAGIRADLLVNAINSELEMERLKNEELIAGKEYTAAELHRIELERIENDRKALDDELKIRLALEPERADEINKAIALNNQRAKTASKKENVSFDKSEKQRKAVAVAADLNNQLSVEKDLSNKSTALKMKLIKSDRQKELDNVELTATERANINAKYDKIEVDLKRETENAKLEILSASLGNVAGLFGKHTIAYKLLASANAVIDTYVGANKALAAYPPPFGAIAAAGVIATGLANVMAINSVDVGDGGKSASSAPTIQTGSRTVTQRAQGKYDVIGNEDGFLYRGVQYGGDVPTGVVSRPTLYGERGAELAVSAPDFRRLQRHINYPVVVQAINDVRSGSVPQRAQGKYDSMSAGGTVVASDPELKMLIARILPVMESLERNGVRGKVLLSDYEDQQTRKKRNTDLRQGRG